MICYSYKYGDLCRHKNIFPVNKFDIWTSILLFIGGTIAAGGGIGGGGVFVPILILLGRFNAEEAIPLSTVLIGAASVANFLQMFFLKHPLRERPLIDYQLAMILQPLSLGGTLVGVILNIMFPNWLLLLLLVLVLFLSLERSVAKGIKLWQDEKRNAMILEMDFRSEGIYQRIRDEDWRINAQSEELTSILESEKKTRLTPFLWMVLVLSVTTLLAVLKGSNRGVSLIGVKPCSALYWVLSFVSLPFLVVVSIVISYLCIKIHSRKMVSNYTFQQGDIMWTRTNTFAMSVIGFIAGLLAGLLGIGGGVIFSPVMLEFGVLPEVAAATSSFMILFTSLAAIIQFSILGRIITDYAIWFGIIGFLCSLLGQAFLTRLVKKYQKTSFIVFCISAIIAVSTILLITIGVMDIVADIKAGQTFGFNSPCP